MVAHCLIMASLVIKVIFGFPSDLFCFLSFGSELWQENTGVKHRAHRLPDTE